MEWNASSVELGRDEVRIKGDEEQKKAFINTLNSNNSLKRSAGRLKSQNQSEICRLMDLKIHPQLQDHLLIRRSRKKTRTTPSRPAVIMTLSPSSPVRLPECPIHSLDSTTRSTNKQTR